MKKLHIKKIVVFSLFLVLVSAIAVAGLINPATTAFADEEMPEHSIYPIWPDYNEVPEPSDLFVEKPATYWNIFNINFVGWYYDLECTKLYDGAELDYGQELYAGWLLDDFEGYEYLLYNEGLWDYFNGYKVFFDLYNVASSVRSYYKKIDYKFEVYNLYYDSDLIDVWSGVYNEDDELFYGWIPLNPIRYGYEFDIWCHEEYFPSPILSYDFMPFLDCFSFIDTFVPLFNAVPITARIYLNDVFFCDFNSFFDRDLGFSSSISISSTGIFDYLINNDYDWGGFLEPGTTKVFVNGQEKEFGVQSGRDYQIYSHKLGFDDVIEFYSNKRTYDIDLFINDVFYFTATVECNLLSDVDIIPNYFFEQLVITSFVFDSETIDYEDFLISESGAIKITLSKTYDFKKVNFMVNGDVYKSTLMINGYVFRS